MADETIPKGTRVPPGAKFKKVWRVRNTGTKSWGSRTTIKCCWGSPDLEPHEKEVAVPPLKPFQEGRVTVRFTAPKRAGIGHFQSHWRFNYKGQPFGQRLICSIAVDPFANSVGVCTSDCNCYSCRLRGRDAKKTSPNRNERALEHAVMCAAKKLRFPDDVCMSSVRPKVKSVTATPNNTPKVVSPPKTPQPESEDSDEDQPLVSQDTAAAVPKKDATDTISAPHVDSCQEAVAVESVPIPVVPIKEVTAQPSVASEKRPEDRMQTAAVCQTTTCGHTTDASEGFEVVPFPDTSEDESGDDQLMTPPEKLPADLEAVILDPMDRSPSPSISVVSDSSDFENVDGENEAAAADETTESITSQMEKLDVGSSFESSTGPRDEPKSDLKWFTEEEKRMYDYIEREPRFKQKDALKVEFLLNRKRFVEDMLSSGQLVVAPKPLEPKPQDDDFVDVHHDSSSDSEELVSKKSIEWMTSKLKQLEEEKRVRLVVVRESGSLLDTPNPSGAIVEDGPPEVEYFSRKEKEILECLKHDPASDGDSLSQFWLNRRVTIENLLRSGKLRVQVKEDIPSDGEKFEELVSDSPVPLEDKSLEWMSARLTQIQEEKDVELVPRVSHPPKPLKESVAMTVEKRRELVGKVQKISRPYPEEAVARSPASVSRQESRSSSDSSSLHSWMRAENGYQPLPLNGSATQSRSAGTQHSSGGEAQPKKPSSNPFVTSHPRPENVIHVLPEALVTGAMNTASHVMQNVGKIFFPLEVSTHISISNNYFVPSSESAAETRFVDSKICSGF